MHNPESAVAGGLYIVDVLGHSIKLAVNDVHCRSTLFWPFKLYATQNLSCLVQSLFGNLSFDESFFEASRQ